jgi:hypothetical protein
MVGYTQQERELKFISDFAVAISLSNPLTASKIFRGGE